MQVALVSQSGFRLQSKLAPKLLSFSSVLKDENNIKGEQIKGFKKLPRLTLWTLFVNGCQFRIFLYAFKLAQLTLFQRIDLFTDTAAILNSEEIMGCPGGR